ncbi:MAG TPA: hypothetical protein VGG32_04705 [Thermoplasmata archaeon]
MSGSLPWSQATQVPPSNDPSAVLQRIEQNTQNTLHWVRITLVAVIVLGIAILLFG